jgi:hypothetical protein
LASGSDLNGRPQNGAYSEDVCGAYKKLPRNDFHSGKISEIRTKFEATGQSMLKTLGGMAKKSRSKQSTKISQNNAEFSGCLLIVTKSEQGPIFRRYRGAEAPRFDGAAGASAGDLRPARCPPLQKT